jgi:hypothetical protein
MTAGAKNIVIWLSASIYQVWWESVEKWHHSGQKHISGHFYATLRHAMPCHMTAGAPNTVKCHSASICQVWLELVEKWYHSGEKRTFLVIFMPRYATPCYATQRHVTAAAPNTVKYHSASICQVWLKNDTTVVKNAHFRLVLRHAAPCHAMWPLVRQILSNGKCIYKNDTTVFKNTHFWSFLRHPMPCHATPCHAMWP